MPTAKRYVVWYKINAGGFVVAWLLQVALDPSTLPQALAVFPLSLKKNSRAWRTHEATPPDVALMCNMFHPNTTYRIDHERYIRRVIDAVLAGRRDWDQLLECRIKMYLVNFVYQSGHARPELAQAVAQDPEKFGLLDLDRIKQLTDILFEPGRNVFLSAPERYLELSAKTKNTEYYASPVNDVLDQYLNLSRFRLESLWQDTWWQDLQTLLGADLHAEAHHSCRHLVSRYLDVMPGAVTEYINAH